MASAATGASASSSKRTLPPDMQDLVRQGPIRKKPKMETKLDTLKAQQKGDAARLKKKIELELQLVKDKGVADEPALASYCDICDDIHEDGMPDENALALLKYPFANYFKEVDVLTLTRTLGEGRMVLHKSNLSAIDRLLASIVKRTEAIRVMINSPTREGDERELMSDQKHANIPPPSQAAKPSNLRIHQTKKDSQTIYDGQPYNGPLLTVYHSIFAEFQVQCRASHDISPEDVSAARALMEASACHFENEAERGVAINDPLHRFLGHSAILDPIEVRGHNKRTWKPDGLVRPECGLFGPLDHRCRTWLPSLIFELMNDLGAATSNPLIQGCFDYDLFCTLPEMKRLRRASCDLSCMPVFILGIIGPYLSIGGAIHLDNHVVFQDLTPYHSLKPLLNVTEPETRYVDGSDRTAADIARILRALRHCLDKLEAEHLALRPEISEVPTGLLYPSPHFKIFEYKKENYELTYRSHMMGDSLSNRSVFRADACGGGSTIPCVVKFAVRYGEKAHRIMEDQGAAVELLYCKWEPMVGQWVVITKYHESLHKKPSQAGIDHLRKALMNLHRQGYVHGDVRAANIIVDDEDKPRFIDFDWSHKIKEARYPNNLNSDIKWPHGGNDGDLIKPEHDLEMLDNYSRDVGAKVTTS